MCFLRTVHSSHSMLWTIFLCKSTGERLHDPSGLAFCRVKRVRMADSRSSVRLEKGVYIHLTQLMGAVTSHTAHQRTPYAFLMPPWSTAEHIGSVSSNFVRLESRTVCFGNKERVDNIEWLCIYSEREVFSPHIVAIRLIFGNCAAIDPRLLNFWKQREEEQSLITGLYVAFERKGSEHASGIFGFWW